MKVPASFLSFSHQTQRGGVRPGFGALGRSGGSPAGAAGAPAEHTLASKAARTRADSTRADSTRADPSLPRPRTPKVMEVGRAEH